MTSDTLAIEPRHLGSRCCGPGALPQIGADEAETLSAELLLIAHPVRMQILDMLARHAGQVCVCDLEAALPVKQATVSHHLRLLRQGGLIDCERQGQWAYYFIKREALTVLRARALDLLKDWT